jgi:tetratricopeptide (TPR) repeat protein
LECGVLSECRLAHSEALAHYKASLELLAVEDTSVRVELCYRIGSLQARMGNYEESLSAFRSMGGSPNHSTKTFFANRHFYLSIIAARRSEIREAQEEIKQCLDLMPEHRKACLLLSRLLDAELNKSSCVSTCFPAPSETTVYDLFPDIDRYRAQFLPDVRDEYFNHVWNLLKPYTLLPIERFYNIYLSCCYIAQSSIPGDFIECGVYLGGSIIAAALFCKYFGIQDRTFYLFDTFCGFPDKMEEVDLSGQKTFFSAMPHFFDTHFRNIVEKNIKRSGLDPVCFKIVEGLVENTLENSCLPKTLAYARLDTDYYDSTLHELKTLWPRLQSGGVLIIDDYGHFEGVRSATDEYFYKIRENILLQRVDYSSRCAVKPWNK